MAKFAGFTTFLCTLLLGFLFGSQLFLWTTNNWYIRDAVFYPMAVNTDDYDFSELDEYEGDANTGLRDVMSILIAACLAAVVYAYLNKQMHTMKKWLIALGLFALLSIMTCIFADRAGPEGIVIDNQYYQWKEVAYVQLHILPSENADWNEDTKLWDYTTPDWEYDQIPNDYIRYTLVMNNGASINVFNWSQLSHLAELDHHVRQLGIKVVGSKSVTTDNDTESYNTTSSEPQTEGLAKIEQGNRTIKLIHPDNGTTVYQEAKVDADYKKRYATLFSGEEWYNAALTTEQKQMLKGIFKR